MKNDNSGEFKYISPQIEIVSLQLADIITASKNQDENAGEWDFSQEGE